MNNKGFTLVELLAVIIILSLLAVLASTSVTKVVTNSKSELYNTQISLIKAAAESWGADNLDRLPSENGQCKYINLGQLKKYGILDSSIKNPKTNKEFSDNMNIKVTSNINSYGNLIIEYEVDPININSCTPMYEKICALVIDADNSNSITPGDKYQCKVKDNMEDGFEDGYYFYMLSNNNDGTVNLIMERNICEDGIVATAENLCLTTWIGSTDYELAGGIGYGGSGSAIYGPITAMNYIYKATKDWYNVPNIALSYNDEGSNYDGIQSTGSLTQILNYNAEAVTVLETEDGYTNLKARLPLYSELSTAGCEDKAEETCPTYLMDYLYDGDYEKYSSLTHIPGIYGYWSLASGGDDDYYAWGVSYGMANNHDVFEAIGVRPVITIPQYNIYN